MTNVTADRLVGTYIKIREKRAQLKAEYDEADGKFEKQMDLVKHKMLEMLKETGSESIKTDKGTLSKTIKRRWWTSDFEAMKQFCYEHADIGGLDLLENRLHQKNLQTFLEEHEDLYPPGLNPDHKFDVSVRKK